MTRAHARSTDPETSHAAAESVGETTPGQEAVLAVLAERGPMDDVALVAAYNAARAAYAPGGTPPLPRQSDSGIRTRRSELAERWLVRDTGRRVKLASGRQAIVWEAHDGTKPPTISPDQPQPPPLAPGGMSAPPGPRTDTRTFEQVTGTAPVVYAGAGGQPSLFDEDELDREAAPPPRPTLYDPE